MGTFNPRVFLWSFSLHRKKNTATLCILTRGVSCLSCIVVTYVPLPLLVIHTWKDWEVFPSSEAPGSSGSGAKVVLSLLPVPDAAVHHYFACWLATPHCSSWDHAFTVKVDSFIFLWLLNTSIISSFSRYINHLFKVAFICSLTNRLENVYRFRK